MAASLGRRARIGAHLNGFLPRLHLFDSFTSAKESFGITTRNIASTSVFLRDTGANGDVEVDLSNGRNLYLSCGKLARFADGSTVAKVGDTSVLVTAISKGKTSNAGFLPLTVDYRQKASAAGRIPTNYLRRELGYSDKEILTSRLIDRSLRPLFPKSFNKETQIMCNLLAVDGIHDPDVICINAASTSLAISDIPWNGPIGAVRVGMIGEEYIINPTRRELQQSSLNLIVAGAEHNLVVMIEGSANNVHQQHFVGAIAAALKETQKIIQEIKKLMQSKGKTKCELPVPEEPSAELAAAIKTMASTKIEEVFSGFNHDKLSRDNAINDIKTDLQAKLAEAFETVDSQMVNQLFSNLCKDVFRRLIFEKNIRCDGRSLTDLRPITCSVNVHKPLHGSAIFQRGQTQVFCTVAFDSPASAARADPVSVITGGIKEKSFMLHYEFPPFATKEIGRPGPPGRRELGHGALAEKALVPIVPHSSSCTIRLTSEVLESNGSSSMASVCGGTLALMDAGVDITAPASGVAVGLVTVPENDSSYKIADYRLLTDILGIEDYFGDMDFKMAGTSKGITALQVDLKIPGIPMKLVTEAVIQATAANKDILKIMHSCIGKPRQDKKDSWPVAEKLEVPAHKRAKFVGVGGFNLRKLIADSGVTVTTIDETTFHVFAPNSEAMNEAKEFIEKLLEDEKEPQLEFGAIYKANIVEIKETGVMVTLYPSMVPTLLHNSQLDQRKINHPSALGIEVGQEIMVKYFGRDPVSGRMRLSRKALQGPATEVIKNLTEKSQVSISTANADVK